MTERGSESQAAQFDWNLFWQEFWKTDRLILAPMEGVVDWVMRDVLTRIGGIDLCVTEFIRVTDQLLPAHAFHKDCPELLNAEVRTNSGTPVLVQLLGGKPEWMAQNAALAIELGAPGIDINFGCPAKTVNRHDGGAALLKDPQRIFDVVSAVRAAIPKNFPVSAKVRLGFSDKSKHLEIAAAAQDGGAAWLTVHARTRDEGYRPPAHWEYIARMREAIHIPVIANGDVWTLEDYERCREITGCRHVMIGRGLTVHPDLALQIQASIALKKSSLDHKGLSAPSCSTELSTEEWRKNLKWLREFALLSREYRHDHYAVCRAKQWMKNINKRFTVQGPELFETIKRFEQLDLILEAIDARLNS